MQSVNDAACAGQGEGQKNPSTESTASKPSHKYLGLGRTIMRTEATKQSKGLPQPISKTSRCADWARLKLSKNTTIKNPKNKAEATASNPIGMPMIRTTILLHEGVSSTHGRQPAGVARKSIGTSCSSAGIAGRICSRKQTPTFSDSGFECSTARS